MPEYKITYFGLYGRAEMSRMLLAHAKADWEDERLTQEEFGAKKAAGEYPNGQVPILYHNGKQMNESVAILRYLGKKLGYYPADDDELCWSADATIYTAGDHMTKLMGPIFTKDFSEAACETWTGVLKTFVGKMDKQLAGHGKKFLCGDKLTIADFMVAGTIFSSAGNEISAIPAEWRAKTKEVMGENKAFHAWFDVMKAEMAEHLANRPPAPF